MKEYQRRVVREHIELAEKIFRLREFMGSDQAMLIPKIEHSDLLNQLDAMDNYLMILAGRIARF